MDGWMCGNEECKKKEKCFRYTAIKSMYQYYSSPTIEDGVCIDFWDNKIKTNKK